MNLLNAIGWGMLAYILSIIIFAFYTAKLNLSEQSNKIAYVFCLTIALAVFLIAL